MRPLPGGDYLLLAQLLDERKQVLGWSLAPFSMHSPVEIKKLDAGDGAFAPQEPLHVKCTIANSYHPLTDARLVTQLDDPRGRILYRSSVPLAIARGETTRDLALDLPHAEHCSARLQVVVLAEEAVLARRSLWLSSERLMPQVDFHVGPHDDFADGWSTMGADMIAGPPRPELGLRPFPWLDLHGAMGQDAGCCDPRGLDEATKCLTASLADAAPWTIVGCIVDDEVNNLGFDSPPREEEIGFFRRYLQETYKDLKALNASWGTDYQSWEEINAELTKVRFATQSDRNPAPWADWYAASEQAAHRFYAALDQAVRRGSTAARLGPSGTRDSNGTNGIDWWLLAHDFRCVCLYNGIHDELYRSFAPAGRLMTNWSHLTGALGDPDSLRVRLWHNLFAQAGGTLVYGGRYSNVFFPDYRPKPGLLAYAAELAAVRDGIGRLILRVRRSDVDPLRGCPAAIFYSPACYRARIVAMRDDEHYTAAAEQNNLLASISTALTDLRIGSHFIAYEQVARGELGPQSTKTLFLWGALALSDAEAAAIRRYLADGGTVVADSEPGLYDEHCHRRAASALHDCLPPKGSVVRQVGKGKFILYGELGPGYVKARGYGYYGAPEPAAGDDARRMSAKLRAVLAQDAGLQGSFRLRDAGGRDFDCDLMAIDYFDGQAHYMACVPNGKFGQSRQARLIVPDAGHLYDCRAGKYLGTAAEHEVELRESTGNLFALLPYQVQRLELSAPARATLGRPIEVKATIVADAGKPYVRHFVVLQLRRPDGRDLPEHRWIVETDNGSAAGRLFLALNDPQGKWTLIARDVATGVSQSATIDLQP